MISAHYFSKVVIGLAFLFLIFFPFVASWILCHLTEIYNFEYESTEILVADWSDKYLLWKVVLLFPLLKEWM